MSAKLFTLRPPDDETSATFAEVDIRSELLSRPYRFPNYEAEDRALSTLATELAVNPQNMLQKLVETALNLCQADTAGISLLETQAGVDVFRWEALAGVFAASRNNTMPRDASPCGVCIDRNTTQLMYLADRCFPALRSDPRFVEALLVPFHCAGRAIGTVWVVMNQFDRKFDAEDERLIRTLAAFASAGWQLWQVQTELERRVLERTAALSEINVTLLKETEERKRAEEERQHLLNRVVRAQEEERCRIARELHDDFVQRLALLEMELVSLQQNPPGDRKKVVARIAPLADQVAAISEDVRKLSHRLHPTILEDLGLEAALSALVSDFETSFGMPLRLIGPNLSHPVPLPIASPIYGITQEALRNAARHAPGAKVTVTLTAS